MKYSRIKLASFASIKSFSSISPIKTSLNVAFWSLYNSNATDASFASITPFLSKSPIFIIGGSIGPGGSSGFSPESFTVIAIILYMFGSSSQYIVISAFPLLFASIKPFCLTFTTSSFDD